MAGQRPLEPKADKKVAEQTVTIPLQEFLRTRDSVVSGLTTLIGVIHELNTAYLKHTSDLLSAGGLAPEVLTQYTVQHYLNPQSQGALLTGGISGLNSDLTKVKKKRAKKEKDPNAPKRPLTAYFLYSIHARPEVKKDLGDSATPVEVNNEILKRWKEMSADKKEVWKEKYEENNKQYKIEVAAYKAKTGVDPEAVADAHDAADEVDEDEEDEEDEDEEPAKPPPPPPAKAKKAKAPKSKAKENGAAPAILSPSPSAQLRVAETPASAKKGDKKRKAEKDVAEPKKKKTKAEAKEAPAPAASKDKKKKKGKGEA